MDAQKGHDWFQNLRINRHWVLNDVPNRLADIKKAMEQFKLVDLTLNSPTNDDIILQLYADPKKIAGLYTGSNLWPGSVGFALWAVSKGRNFWIGKRVLEIGSGLGLAGLTLSALGASVTLTDIKELVPLLQQNVDLNADKLQGGYPEVSEMYWGQQGTYGDIFRDSFDMVVGTDVTISDDTISALLHVLSTASFYSSLPGEREVSVYIASSRSGLKCDSSHFLSQAQSLFKTRLEAQVKGYEISKVFPSDLIQESSMLPSNMCDVDIHVLSPKSLLE
ncbi:hypothetical protein AAMO2058_001450000 [Amorphochlora amoebiformis]